MDAKDILASGLTIINIFLTIRVNYIVKRQDDRAKNYTELDKAYDALLKEAAADPDLRDPGFAQEYLGYKAIEGGKHKLAQQYEIYAFRCMNFCETIYDTSDSNLRETWVCIIKTESKLHSTWFERSENKERFKERFTEYIGNGCEESLKNKKWYDFLR